MGVKGWGEDLIPWRWVSLEEISPAAIGIDVPNYFTQRVTAIKTRAQPGMMPLAHVGAFLSLVKASLSAQILPVLIFDGPPQTLKRQPNHELIQRASELYQEFLRERDPYNEEISSVLWKSPALRMYFAAQHLKTLGSVVGIPVITAPSEAEMLAAALCRQGVVRTVLSNDIDTLLFGSPHMTKRLQVTKKRVFRVLLSDLETRMGLDLEQLRNLAILCGCDFHHGAKGIGPRKGTVLLQRYGNLIEVLKAKGYTHTERQEFQYAREVFDEPNYLSTDGYSFSLNPPIVPKLIRSLTPVMATETAEKTVQKITRLWRDFGNQQASLDQWL